jgi:two-component system sensor histidine kinase TctE
LLVPLGVAAALELFMGYDDARNTATRVQDQLLLGSARIIAQQIHYDEEVLEVAIPPAALELFQSPDGDLVYYRIASARGLLLSGYAEVPPPPTLVRPEESAAFTTVVRDQPVRVVAYAQPVFAAPQESPVVIEVAQTSRGHDRMVRQIMSVVVWQELCMMLLVAVLVWIALRPGLGSLVRLGQMVGERTPGSLEPLDPGPVPRELQPLVAAFNGYIQRLDAQMAARGRFIANASHQLRTPFTVLQTQVNFALKATDPAVKEEALAALSRAVRSGIRLVNQLLSLSVAEAGGHTPVSRVPVDLAAVAQQVLEEQAALAQAKDIDLGVALHAGDAHLSASPAMVHELVANLVDNALRYTQPKGVVTVSLDRDPEGLMLKVEDNGPGIPPQDRARVFERFIRLDTTTSNGCGLGLAIVQEIVQNLGGRIELGEPPAGSGLMVTVRFPGQPR